MSSLANLTRSSCSASSSGEDRLDRLARAAPGRPEVDDDRVGRPAGPRCSKVASVSSSTAAMLQAARERREPQAGTFQIASSTIARLIFEPPTSRSAKRIGISTTRKPARSAR